MPLGHREVAERQRFMWRPSMGTESAASSLPLEILLIFLSPRRLRRALYLAVPLSPIRHTTVMLSPNPSIIAGLKLSYRRALAG